MTSEEPVIILDDDDDDDVEFIGSNLKNTEQPKVQKQSRNQLPINVNGYTRPSIHYPKLITNALITCPDKQATENRICEIIAEQNPYFQHCPNTWYKSIKSALKRRKKFFLVVGVNQNKETIWSLNPEYEKLMIKLWIPKYMKSKYLPQETEEPKTMTPIPFPVIVSAGSVTPPSPVIVSFESLRPQSPVFVSSGKTEFVNYEALIPETNLEEDESTSSYAGPEFVLEDPGGISDTDHPTNHDQSAVVWEPAATVSANSAKESKSVFGRKSNQPLVFADFTLDNLIMRQINNEEIQYRLDFQRDHTNVEKFRLHCTVCDAHLGTSGIKAKFNVRFHSSLGVLVCTRCYTLTRPPSAESSCKWCGGVDKEKYSCEICPSNFCEDCLRRNFGHQWYQHVFENINVLDPRWKCLMCDPKQIWPHRAIAYFLYRHYKELKRKKLLKLPDKYSAFFKVDLSTCCKDNSSKGAANPPLLTPLPHSVSENPQTFTIGSQSPNQIYLNTPPAVSSVTLNTGTQYIHNVYPDRNYVFVQAPIQDGNTVATSTVLSSDGKTLQTSTIPRTVTSNSPIPLPESIVSSKNDLASPNFSFPNLAMSDISTNKPNSQDKNYLLPPPSHIPLDNAQVQMINPQSWSQPLHNRDTNLRGKTELISLSKSSKSEVLYAASKNTAESNSNVEGVKTVGPLIVTSSTQKDTNIIVPDNESAEIILHDPKPLENPMLTAKQMIERRPMPKSKKQSLLRMVLMNESIESMRRHLNTPQADASSEIALITEDEHIGTPSNPSLLSKQSSCEENHQTVEEPILQSIIESATQRLFELKNKQDLSSNSSVSVSGETVVTQDQTSNLPLDTATTLPKIKIRTLKELQDQNIFNNSEQNNSKTSNNAEDLEGCNSETMQGEKGKSIDEINVTPLKEGIIEACRTLLSTQRKFKELALLISSNLLYQREKAQDLVSKFQDILMSCQNQFVVIDKNLKKEFCNFISYANMDSLLESVKKSSNESISGTNLVIKKRKKKASKIHSKNKKLNTLPNPAGEALQQMETNACAELYRVEETSNVDSHPTGIQLLSEPSNENQSLMSQHINNWRILKAKKKTKRCMWNDKRKKRGRVAVRYKKDGTLMKRLGRRPKSQTYDDTDEADELYDSTSFEQRNSDQVQRLRKRIRKPVPPLRISGRRHPSSEEYIAHLISTDMVIESENYQIDYNIKPCSVLLHRLDPRIVELLKWRAAKVL